MNKQTTAEADRTPKAIPRIVSATVGKAPTTIFGDMPDVTVKLDDGSEATLFSFFPDEISFTPSEFVGLTKNEAYKLKQAKDKAYLQS